MRLRYVVLAALVLVVSSALAAGGDPLPGEVGLFEAVNHLPTVWSPPITAILSLGTLTGVVILAAVVAVRGKFVVAGRLVGAWMLARFGSWVLKALVDRERPTGLLPDLRRREHFSADAGFPSAHTAIAFAVAYVLWRRWPGRGRLWFGAAALIAVLRLYVGVHLPLDLVGGVALGLLCGRVAALWSVDRDADHRPPDVSARRPREQP